MSRNFYAFFSTLFLTSSLAFFPGLNQLRAQCPEFQTALINSCSNTSGQDESEGEFIVFSSGSGGFNVNDLGFDLDPNNSGVGTANDDLGIEGTCAFSGSQSFTGLPGCANTIFVGPGDFVPPNAIVILFMDVNTDDGDVGSVDWTALCGSGETVYIMQNGCDRTIGAFSNATNTNDTRTYSITPSGGCSDVFSYNRQDLFNAVSGNANGSYYTVTETPNYGGDNSCVFPPFENPCPAPETQVFTLCAENGLISPAQSLSPAESLFAGASDVTFHTTQTGAENNTGEVMAYGGAATTPVDLFARVTYPDGCVVIGTLTLNFLEPDGNAGSDATLTTCSSASLDLLGALGGGVTAGTFSDDNGSGVNLGNPANVDFTGVPTGTYNFTYTATDDPGTPCPPDEAVVTVDVTASPVANAPVDDLIVCYTIVPPAATSNLDDIVIQISGGLPLTYYLDAGRTQPIDPNDPADQALLVVLQPTTVFADFTVNGCPSNVVTINVQLFEQPIGVEPQPLTACDLGAGFGEFNLAAIEGIISGGSGEQVNYFFDQNGVSPINNPGTFLSGTAIVYAFVGDQPCPSAPVEVSLNVVTGPTINDLVSDVECNGADDGSIALFPLGNGPFSYDWDDDTFDGQETLTPLPPGMYSVTVTDDNNCTTEATYTINEPTAISLVSCAAATQASTPAAMDGTATVTVSGGTGPYTISYNGQQTGTANGPGPDITLTGLGAGDYTVVSIEDVNGCTVAVNCSFTVTSAGGGCTLNVTEAVTPITCVGADDGVISLTISGEVGPLTIDWSVGGFQDQDMATVGPGTYSVTVTDNGVPNCVVILDDIQVNNPAAIDLLCSQSTPASAPGVNDGAATVEISGGTPNHTVVVTGPTPSTVNNQPNGTVNLNNLLPGDYTVAITDANGCMTSCTFTITSGDPPCMLSVSTVENDITCAGADDGRIELVVSGNNTTVDYDWDNPVFDGDSVITSLPPGTYMVTVTDGPNCVAILTFNITEPDSFLLSCMATNQTSAPNTADGSGVSTHSGGTAPYEIQLNGPVMDTLFGVMSVGTTNWDNLPVGLYTVTVIDDNGCSETCQFTVTSAGCTLDVMVDVTNISCFGENDGRISLLISGNIGSVFVDWDNDAFDGQQDIGGLGPGDYAAVITDAGGCVLPIGPITISEPQDLMIECSVLNDVTHPNAANGAVEGIVTGGTGPYEVITRRIAGNISDTITIALADTVEITGLSGGTPPTDYELIVIDANGCSDTCMFSILEPPCPNIFFQEVITDVGCNGDSTGRIEVNVVNATEPIQYIWTPVLPDTNVLDNVPAGTYTLVVIDSNQCTAAQAFQVVEPTSSPTLSCLAIDDESSPGLADGSASYTVTGNALPFTLAVSGPLDSMITVSVAGTDTLENLPAGTYNLVITDNNGCATDTCSFTIEPGLCTLAASGTVTQEDCTGPGQIDLTVTGNTLPLTFDWNDDTLDGQEDPMVTAGDYSVTISNSAGCADTLSFTVPRDQNDPSISISDNGDVCVGDSIGWNLSFNGVGPFSVEVVFTPGAQITLGNLPSDTTIQIPTAISTGNSFSIEVISFTDARGCGGMVNDFRTIFINFPDTIRRTDVLCAGDTATIAGQVFTVDAPSDTFLVPGMGCGELYEVDLNFVEAVIPDTLELTLCPGDTLALGDQVFDGNNPENLVRFDIPNQAGCDSSLYVRIDFFPASQGFFSTTVCRGDTVFVEGEFFTFENQSGIVVLEGQAANGCDSLLAVAVNFLNTPEVRLRGDNSICLGDTTDLRFELMNAGSVDVVLRDSDGNTLSINGISDNEEFEVMPEFNTTYTIVSATSGNPCPVEVQGSAEVLVSRLVGRIESDIDFGGFQISCNGANDGGLTLIMEEGVPPFDISWSTGAFTTEIDNLPPGNYQVDITDSVGCSQTLTAFVQEPPGFVIDSRAIGPGCTEVNGRIRLNSIAGGIGPYEVSLDGQFFQQVASFPFEQFVAPGNYQLFLQDAADCSTTVDIFVPDSEDPSLILPNDTIILLGDSLVLTAQTDFDPDSIRWEPADRVRTTNSLSTVVVPLESTRFRLTLTDTLGCSVAGTVFVQVDERVPIYVPNAFSPNADGANDLFQVYGDRGVDRIDVFRIFDRWGEMVYEQLDFDPANPNIGWDGTLDGQTLNPAVFVFYVKATLTDGRAVELKGDLVLRR